jgi:hypothetical protein
VACGHLVWEIFTDIIDGRVRLKVPEDLFIAVRMSNLPNVIRKRSSGVKCF